MDIAIKDLGTQLHETLLVEQLFALNVIHSAFVIHGIKKWLNAEKTPLASFIITFINCYISGILVNLMCAQPLLSGMKNTQLNCAIVFLWWTINFAAPGVYDFIFSNKFILLVLLFLKECLRCRKLYTALDKGIAAYDGHLLLSVVVGTSGACGGGFIKHGMALYRNDKINSSFASATKCSAFFTMFYMLAKMEILTSLDQFDIIAVQTLFMTFHQFMAKCNKSFDPFALPEKILCEVFFTMGRDLPPKAATKETKKSK